MASPNLQNESTRSTNLAARMGRWSARHRKTAIFGWLAFVVLAFAAGIVSGTTKIDQATSGVGESGRVDKLLHEEFVQPAGESVLVQSETLTVKDPGLRSCRRGRHRQGLRARRGHEHPLTARPRKRGPDRPERRRGADRLRDHRRSRRRDDQDRSCRRRRRRRSGGESGALHRLVRRQRRQGGRGRVHGRPQEGRVALDPVTLIILIVVFGALVAAGHPASARAHGHRRDVRAGRAPELAHPDRRGHLRAHPPHRARGRRRLLDVLFEAGA